METQAPIAGPEQSQQLQLDYFVLCNEGGKQGNEDAAAALVPESAHLLTYKGAIFTVADGVSSAEAGREASTTAVRTFIQDYPKTPDTWSVSHSAGQVLSTINLRLYRHSHAFANEMKGQLCTFSTAIIKSHSAHIFHVGDSRVYHWRKGQCQQLTHDHTAHLSQDRHFLARALGMDSNLQLDHQRINLQIHDKLLLSSDGLHEFVSLDAIQEALNAGLSAQATAEQLFAQALANGCDDNVSIIVVDIHQLPNENIDDYHEKLTKLPFPPAFSPGMKVDGYEIISELFASSRSHLYLVRDNESGAEIVMKTPSENFSDDTAYIERFIREEWIGSRIESPHVTRIIRQNRPRSFLYYLMEYVEGVNMERWLEINQPIKPARALSILEQVAAGLQAFHDCEAIHQDLKPGNIIIQQEPGTGKETAKIVDFGSVFVAGVAEIFIPIDQESVLGTAAYSDPLYLTGKNSAIQGDVYALATIAYELFTGKLPYGSKIEECKTPSDYDRLRYISARKANPAIPVWLDRALEKGVSFDLQVRYTTLASFLRDIRQPNPEFLRDEVKQSTRGSSLLFWQLLSGFWFVTLLLVIYLFVINRG
ncbi:MAG: protein phosphatase 2C domain-containing protein [Aliidiomarina sp.]|uniref:bifunctional protein-serine/threonine kinase/phosphatase n=1 Tax=Aliidiomarina sp. TaxID=1872439 RepID=UPI0025B8E3B9|nr:bifunctional protein-serine/threonine kinase/phosphatase [Aliidiomarina sp.]MCH8501128.1 protein phosphatase 2C domain-containing protein [Aliidiomarina sp.]